MTGPAGPEPDRPEPAGPGPAGPRPAAPGQARAGDDPEERDPGLARERTSLSWRRTAISFAALGGVVLKENVFTGLVILAIASVVWQLGRVARGSGPRADLPAVGATRLFIITVSIVAVALLCLAVAVFGKAVPGALR
jgi:uncharacterized membrane protein YidH (DUF202 family)